MDLRAALEREKSECAAEVVELGHALPNAHSGKTLNFNTLLLRILRAVLEAHRRPGVSVLFRRLRRSS